jgi:ankyrin repeat/IBR domain-containing protein 1
LLEEPLLNSARRKMELLAASLPAARSPVLGHSDSKDVPKNRSSMSSVPACTRFIEEGIRELLKARRILCGSYVYGLKIYICLCARFALIKYFFLAI